MFKHQHVSTVNIVMKITELLNTPKKSHDTISSGTTYSIESEPQAQDIVSQDHVPQKIVAEQVDGRILEMPDHSAIAEGVSQIFRRQKGGKPTKGFRCTSGPRKGRIVAKPSTCFQKDSRQEIGSDQKVGSRSKETGRSSDQEKKRHSTKTGWSENRFKTINEIQNGQG